MRRLTLTFALWGITLASPVAAQHTAPTNEGAPSAETDSSPQPADTTEPPPIAAKTHAETATATSDTVHSEVAINAQPAEAPSQTVAPAPVSAPQAEPPKPTVPDPRQYRRAFAMKLSGIFLTVLGAPVFLYGAGFIVYGFADDVPEARIGGAIIAAIGAAALGPGLFLWIKGAKRRNRLKAALPTPSLFVGADYQGIGLAWQ